MNRDAHVADIMEVLGENIVTPQRKTTARTRSPRRPVRDLGTCVTSCLAAFELQQGISKKPVRKRSPLSGQVRKVSPRQDPTKKRLLPRKKTNTNPKESH